jgi:molybdopterin biosynthesis enzyme
VGEEDLDHLRRLGKENLFVLHIEPDEVHEDEAAVKLAKALAGKNVIFNEKPAEGKISLKSDTRGLLKVNVVALNAFNMVPDVTCSSRHNNVLVDEGEIIAATRAIPLIIHENLLTRAVEIAEKAGGIFSIKRLSRPRTGLIVTGNEVFYGRIQDKFAPLIRKKMSEFECEIVETIFAPDDKDQIILALEKLLSIDPGLILVSGGMSVDPDDVSRLAIAEAGAEDILYGSPVLPGAMFLYARFGDIPVFGLPACILFYRSTVFDILLPRILAGEKITRENLASMGHGGLCLNCEQCRYPVCPFGK